MHSFRALLVSAALAGAAIAPAAAHGATILDRQAVPTRVAAYDDIAMWSHLDPATGRYRLVKSENGGAPSDVPVPERDRPFDVDLGTSRSGRTLAVYTREGDVYQLDIASGAETTVAMPGSATDRDPTIQGGRIAFIRATSDGDELRIATTTGSRLLVTRPAIVSAELGTRHIAYVESGDGIGYGEHLVHIRNLQNGRDRIVYRAQSGGMNLARVTKPSYSAQLDSFTWARTNSGSGQGNRLVRYQIPGSLFLTAPGSAHWTSTAWAGYRLGAVTATSLSGTEPSEACSDDDGQLCEVALTGPVHFTRGTS